MHRFWLMLPVLLLQTGAAAATDSSPFVADYDTLTALETTDMNRVYFQFWRAFNMDFIVRLEELTGRVGAEPLKGHWHIRLLLNGQVGTKHGYFLTIGIARHVPPANGETSECGEEQYFFNSAPISAQINANEEAEAQAQLARKFIAGQLRQLSRR